MYVTVAKRAEVSVVERTRGFVPLIAYIFEQMVSTLCGTRQRAQDDKTSLVDIPMHTRMTPIMTAQAPPMQQSRLQQRSETVNQAPMGTPNQQQAALRAQVMQRAQEQRNQQQQQQQVPGQQAPAAQNAPAPNAQAQIDMRNKKFQQLLTETQHAYPRQAPNPSLTT